MTDDPSLRIVALRPRPGKLMDFFRKHPRLAEVAAIALIRAGGAEPNWSTGPRRPPISLQHRAGHCPLCQCRSFAGGAWWMQAGEPPGNLRWHPCCVVAWQTWNDGTGLRSLRWLIARQQGICPETGDPVGPPAAPYVRYVEIDHVVPIWRVRRERERHQWPEVLRFWGLGNFQALSARGHKIKTAREAGERAELRKQGAET